MKSTFFFSKNTAERIIIIHFALSKITMVQKIIKKNTILIEFH